MIDLLTDTQVTFAAGSSALTAINHISSIYTIRCVRTCIPYTANGINTGDMVDCCEGRGAGSKGGLTVDDQAQQKVCGRN